MVRRVEEAALLAETDIADAGAATDGLAKLVQGRIMELYGKLEHLLGPDRARDLMNSVTDQHSGSAHREY